MIDKQYLMPLGLGTAIVAGLVLWVAWPKSAEQVASASNTWTCSMHPQIRLTNPGQCPICGMALIPILQLPSAKDDLEKRAGLETEAIVRRELFKEIRTVGKLDYSERQVELITARISGRVDRLYVDFTGIEVKRNDHLVDIYSPELYSAQAELIRSLDAYSVRTAGKERTLDQFAESNLSASREKLRLWGLRPEQIAEIEKTKNIQTHITIYAPRHGTVIEKNIRAGQYVREGDPLYRIANLDPIWLYLNIYEFDVAWVRFGQPVDVTLEAFAGESIRGTVTFIDPFLDDSTRTIRVRVNLKNADRRLKPQMYAQATIHVPLRPDGSPEPTGAEGKYICPMHPEVIQTNAGICPFCEMLLDQVPEFRKGFPTAEPAAITASSSMPNREDRLALAIPVSAVLDTGRRQIAYRLTPEGAYELVELKLGSRAQAVDNAGRRRDYYLVLDGLQESDRVVVQSGFLLDSQRQIEGMPSLLYPAGQPASMSGHAGHDGRSTNSSSSHPPPSPVNKMPSGHQH
jgi:membrane fusion protein, copper/silver efflux system